ncbi:MAG: family 78 glycoside hydrolase catalytic domain [Prevotella sp.]|nr:family 78 glycoside hydrolase catalytic domain [Prevotella sp.]
MRKVFAFLLLLSPSLLTAHVIDLRCEDRVSPLGIDTTEPHFSWKNTLDHNGQLQKSYEIQVASDSILLATGKADLWKSGKVKSQDQVMVPYQGLPLKEKQLCYWRVRTWDEHGRRSKWSAVARFAVGILSEMKGEYIGSVTEKSEEKAFDVTPMFRKTLRLSPRFTTFAHVNSLGYHELYVNGRRVGNTVLQPAMSQLDQHSLIVTYDITPYLHDGDNEIIIWTGQGWYKKQNFNAQYDGPLVKAEFDQLVSGQWQTIAQTDGSWQALSSGYTYTGTWYPLQFGGEKVDGLSEMPKNRDRLPWHSASTFVVENMHATPQLFDGNRIIDRLNPQTITPSDGSILVDFGRVVTGWLQVDFDDLAAGQEVLMEYTDYIPAGSAFESQGESDVYVAKGTGKETFRNRFHHHAFRYVRINTAHVRKATALQISGLSPREASAFACDDKSLNAVHDMIHYTMQCLTFSGYMVDCPHLERMGYGGDGNSSTMTLQTMYNVSPTYMNWLSAWGDTMDEDGSLPHVAPAGGGGGGPYWCGFIVKAPWRTYLNYGDNRLLKRHYGQMKLWLSYVRKYMKNDLLHPWPDTKNRMWFLGDWLAPNGIDVGGESVIHANNCFISDCLANMTAIATQLGHDDDARYYASWRETLNRAIHEKFYHPATETYANGTPLDQAYALLAGVPTDATLSKKVEQRLVSDSYGRYNTHIAAGLFGVPVFTEWAIRSRQANLMAAILRQKDYPGYLYMIENGATTTWEYWNGERSRVHNCYNGIGTWFYQAMAGIRPDYDAPGYRHFFIDPQPVEGITHVEASKPTPYGTIRIEKNGREVRVVIPVGTTATAFPSTAYEQVLPAGEHTLVSPEE